MVFNPNVNITVNKSLSLSPGDVDTVIMIMGTAQWGPEDAIREFSSFGAVLETYKDDVDDNTSIIKAAELAYANGAKIVKVVRVTDAGAAKATLALDGNTGAEAGVLTFTGQFKGQYGNNFTVDVDTVGSGRTVTITNGDFKEVFDNAGNANGYATNALIGTAINDATTGSVLVDVAVKAGSESSNLVDALVAAQSLASGDDGANGLIASDYTTAFDNIIITEDWDLLIIGDTDNTNLETSDSFHTSIMAKINSRVTNHKKYSMYVTGVDKDESQSTIQARTTTSSRFVLTAPNIETTSRVDGTDVILDGSYLGAAVAGMIAGQDIEVAITRKVVTVADFSINESTSTKYYTLAQIESLLGSGVCVASKIAGALKVARGVTRIADTSDIFYEINIRRIVDDITTRTQDLLDDFLGDPNLLRIRKTIAAEVDGLLNQSVFDEEIVAYEPAQVAEGLSPDIVTVSFSIQPTFAINFINVIISVSQA